MNYVHEPTLALEDLVARGIYRLQSRNLAVGVFDSEIGFIGIREKFNDLYLFKEYHYDHGGMHGTARPLELLGLLDASIPIRETLGPVCGTCKRPVSYVKWEEGEESNGFAGRWCHLNEDRGVDTDVGDHSVDPWAVRNTALYAALEVYDPQTST
jgi:hypothetical protein